MYRMDFIKHYYYMKLIETNLYWTFTLHNMRTKKGLLIL